VFLTDLMRRRISRVDAMEGESSGWRVVGSE